LSLTSGTKTFAEVQSPTEAMFPAVDTPTTQEITERIQQDSVRLTDATADVAAEKSAADDAETIALIGLIAGCIGIAVGVITALWVGWIGWTRLHDRGFPRVPRPGAYGLLGVAGVLVVTSAFVPRALLGPKTPSSNAPRPASTATIAFRSPTDHQKISGSELD